MKSFMRRLLVGILATSMALSSSSVSVLADVKSEAKIADVETVEDIAVDSESADEVDESIANAIVEETELITVDEQEDKLTSDGDAIVVGDVHDDSIGAHHNTGDQDAIYTIETEDHQSTTVSKYGYIKPDHEPGISYSAQDEIEAEIPSSYDSRAYNYITPVRNQGSLGTCWAHSALASTEASMVKNNGASLDKINYSERQLAWFAYNSKGTNDPIGNTGNDYNEIDGDNKLAFDLGGNDYKAAFSLTRWQGSGSETVSGLGYAGDAVNNSLAYKADAHVQNVYFYNKTQTDKIKRAVMDNGAISISYGDYGEPFYNKSKASYYCNTNYDSNHAVTLVGWDDNYSADNFTYKPSRNGAWLIKNSWGTGYGNKGYFWLSYEDKTISDFVSYEAEPVDNYNKNYFYSGTNALPYWITSHDGFANVFTATDNEVLKAVGIFMFSTDASYTIQIYKNPSNISNPTSGTPMLSSPQTGKTTYEGYYTIPLNQSVELSEGDKFAVVFTFSGSKSIYMDETSTYWVEDNYGNVVANIDTYSSANKGQSYYKSGSSWYDYNSSNTSDAAEGSNCRIHAYTVLNDEANLTPPTAIVLDDNVNGGITLNIDDYYRVKYSVLPQGANKELIWSSSNESVATVDSNGAISTVSEGTTTITAVSALNPSVKVSFPLVVKLQIEGISLSFDFGDNFDLFIDSEGVRLVYDITPVQYEPEGAAIWKSSNPNVVTVDKNGVLTPKKIGASEISVTIDGVTASKEVNVCCHYIYPQYRILYSGAIELYWDKVVGADYYEIFDEYDSFSKILARIQDIGKESYSYKDSSYVNKPNWKRYGSTFYIITPWTSFYDKDDNKVADQEWFIDDCYLEVDKDEVINRNVKIKYCTDNKTKSDTKTYTYGSTNYVASLEDCGFKGPEAGYEFAGWYDKDNDKYYYPGDSIDTAFADLVSGTTIELEAQYRDLQVEGIEAEYTNGEVVTSGDEVSAGTKINLSTPTVGAHIYYKINGGAEQEYVGSIVLDNDTEVTKDITITAYGKKDQYKDSDECDIALKVKSKINDPGKISEYDYKLPDFPNPKDISDELWVYGVKDATYTGAAITYPDMKVYYGKTPLTLGVDYTVKYENNIKASSDAKVVITGKADYNGTCKVPFTIMPKDINSSDITMSAEDLAFNEKEQKLKLKVTDVVKGKVVTLKEGVDYTATVDASQIKDVRLYTVTVKGIGNYANTATESPTFHVTEAVLASKLGVSKIPNQAYTASAITLDNMKLSAPFTVKSGKTVLTEGEDGHYVVEYEDNVKAGKANLVLVGTGNKIDGVAVIGVRKISFNIVGTPISKAVVDGMPKTLVYKGEAWKASDKEFKDVNLYIKETRTTPRVVLTPYNEETGKGDYTVSVEANKVNVGNIKVTITGKNGYTGSVTKTIKITPFDFNNGVGGALFETMEGSLSYVKGGVKPEPQITYVSDSGKEIKLVLNKDYKLKYTNNNAINDGSNQKKLALVKITGTGNFKGTLESDFTIEKKNLGYGKVTGYAQDVVYKNSAGNYKTKLILNDESGVALKQGTDYEKNVVFRYVNTTQVQTKVGRQLVSVTRSANQAAGANDIVPAGTVMAAYVKGTNNYEGTLIKRYRIIERDIAKATATIDPQIYCGNRIEPTKDDIELFIGKDIRLGATDYEIVSYGVNRSKKGTVVIHGINNYGGYKTITFKINSSKLQ